MNARQLEKISYKHLSDLLKELILSKELSSKSIYSMWQDYFLVTITS